MSASLDPYGNAADSRQGVAQVLTGRESRRWTFALFLIVFCIYCLTSSRERYGYEGNKIFSAEAFAANCLNEGVVWKTPAPCKGGLLEIAGYVPSAFGKHLLQMIDQGSAPRKLAYAFVLPFFSALLCVVFFGIALELYRRPEPAAAATMLLAFGTMVWPYSKFGMEVLLSLTTWAGIWALLRFSRNPTRGVALAFGVSVGLVLLTKFSGTLHAAALGLSALWLFLRHRWWRRERIWTHAVWAVSPILIGASVFLISNQTRYGGWLYGGRYDLAFETNLFPLWEGVLGACFSPGKSVFLFSPVLIIGLWHWDKIFQRLPEFRCIAVTLFCIAAFHLSFQGWAEETWGPRRLHYLVVFMALPLGFWWEKRNLVQPRVRGLIISTLGIALAVQILAVSFNYGALPFIVGRSPIYSHQNLIWNPRFSGVLFNLHLLHSTIVRMRTGDSIPFFYDNAYIPYHGPEEKPGPLVFVDMKGWDKLDFWFLQLDPEWPAQKFTYPAWKAILFALFGSGFVAGVLILRRRARYWQSE